MHAHNFKDLTGQPFGRLRVIGMSLVRSTKSKKFWECECNCKDKNIVIIRSDLLTRGITNSCGCLKVEVAREQNTKHGGKGTAEYKVYDGMKQRCNNVSNARYKDYGGRGIKVCQDWMDSFENFIEDMGPHPSKLHSLDRIDVNGNYCPENCRWATAKEQQNNMRSNCQKVECQGKCQTLLQWSQQLGVSVSRIRARIRSGWSITRALFTK